MDENETQINNVHKSDNEYLSSSQTSTDSGIIHLYTKHGNDSCQETNIHENKYSYKKVLREVTNDKKTCFDFLQQQGVLPKGKVCPGPFFQGKRMNNCGSQMVLKNVKDRKDGLTWRCRKTHKISTEKGDYKIKDVKVSIRDDTWIQNSNLSLEVITELVYLWSQHFTNSAIEHELNISHQTIIEWSAYLRDVCNYTVMQESEQIGGPGIHVEIDESKFGKRKYYRGKRVKGQWVFGGRETKDKSKIFMVPVKKRNAKTLIPIIEKWIKKGSIIHSDCWKAYNKLNELGYTHVTVNHSKEFLNPETQACTNRIESDWRHAKVSMPRYGVHKGLHSGYLAEFMWMRKYHDDDKFLILLQNCTVAFQSGHFCCIKY